MDEHRQRSFERLQQLVDRGGFAVVHGQPGCGKTRLLRHLAQQLNTNTHQPVYMPHSTLNESGMLQTLAWQLGIQPAHSKPKNIKNISEHIKAGKTPVLIFDELQHASHQTMESMRLLCEGELNAGSRIPAILAGTDEFIGLLSMNICESMRQRITLCVKLAPLTAEQVPKYIGHHFRQAQAVQEILTPQALQFIIERTGGILRLIEHLTRSALEIAADDQSQMVELRHVDEAANLTFVPLKENTP
jgi:type II secretory pathway predicted ATPase ExeA